MLHNPQGAEIAIELLERSDTVVVIEDNGVGIDRDEIPRLTERFYRGDNSNTGGSGLGLAIVKHALPCCDATSLFILASAMAQNLLALSLNNKKGAEGPFMQ